MSEPTYALQAAITAVLKNDTALATLLGGAKIYDSAPGNQQPPWIIFEDNAARINDVSGSEGHIHRIVLHCVSDQPGSKEATAIAARVAALLHDQPLTLAGHTLINLRVEENSLRRSGKKPFRVIAVRLRAVTEVQP